MRDEQKWKRARSVVLAITLAAMVCAPATADAQLAGKYPDLRPQPPDDLHLSSRLVGEENHYVVELSHEAFNAGEGPLELHGTPHLPPDLTFDVEQWIYADPAGVLVEPVGTFYFHQAHQHFHFEDFATYELWSARDFDRASARGFTSGAPLYASEKVSFCIEDSAGTHRDPAVGPSRRVYQSCTPALQGISQGWGDIYDYTLPDQLIDVGPTPLPDGKYVIRTITDPENKLFESPGKSDPARESRIANSAIRYIEIVDGQLRTT